MDIKSFQTNLDLTNFKFDKYANIVKQNEEISKKRADIYKTDRNFHIISENESENYIGIKNNEPITSKKYKDYIIYSDNENLLYYEGTNAYYAITKDTDINLLSKISLADKMFLLNKNDTTDEKVVVKDEAYFMQKMLDDMIIEQTSFMLGKKLDQNYDVWHSLGFGRNYSYANKFSPDIGNYKADNYSNQNSLVPNSYYLNSYANSNLIDTKFGKAELFLDLAGDNDKLGVGSFSSNSQLFRFDSDGNGFVDKNDTYFDKLKIRAYDKDGNEIIKKLSEVVDSINLKDFIDTKSNAIKKWKEEVSSYNWDEKTYKEQLNIMNSYNPYSIFKAEVRYESMNENDIKELSKLANEDGWIDASKLQGLANLAYAKQGIDGNYKLEELSYLGANSQTNSYTNEQYSKFNSLYEDYMAEFEALNGFFDSYKQTASSEIMAEFGEMIENPEFKSTRMLKIESEFSAATGLDFTLDNLQKVKDSFEKDRANTANMLKDTDALTAIKINKNGTFTLRFNSGREINVDKLYKDSGKAFDVELNLNAEFMSEEELNQNLDLSVSAANIKDKITGEVQTKSLKDLGVQIIKKLTNGKFALQTNDGRNIIVDQIYTMFNQISNQDNKQNQERNQNSELNLINDKDRFYPKPLRIWA
ncbi:hypothetical protein FFA43_00795 [Campylobacter hyointestinalis subsp. hyointestinalis]|uniref:hypothetical protein n=1 Tax=Campylobacter hyointestinalis TaxID=198 RepID=UPI00072A91EA|nr:hypothetical protein [Campylobacter hyointestinalis]PPB54352.1 hypothetical protein CDQ69_02740 [Campylobacter hyointestinalis subsp. hyointestinalis]PPB57901.1 hypothetical protein CDQ71_02965 [Campylobacter hyointestinalis subsp. hyointestinalis]PPB63498.1 hypothetical protein CDQ72_00710 [Campylobacter hyointestinalis subsp. hyointestinalis]PPB65047.1 hypothetical protein CDQ73_03090 [Campylobacter hyointestinalis subsp. hyointestinalis]PPB68192.1 hypothetical protein CDQ77_08195 [Campyl